MVPWPRPREINIKTQPTVGMVASRSIKSPFARSKRPHPNHRANRNLSILVIRTLTITLAGSNDRESGKRATPVMVGEKPLTASK